MIRAQKSHPKPSATSLHAIPFRIFAGLIILLQKNCKSQCSQPSPSSYNLRTSQFCRTQRTVHGEISGLKVSWHYSRKCSSRILPCLFGDFNVIVTTHNYFHPANCGSLMLWTTQWQQHSWAWAYLTYAAWARHAYLRLSSQESPSKYIDSCTCPKLRQEFSANTPHNLALTNCWE